MNMVTDFEVPILDSLAKTHVEAGNPLIYDYTGFPYSRVTSSEPFEDRRYGIFRNRAPYISEPVAVMGFTALNELWPGVIISSVGAENQPNEELHVAGFTPYEYRSVASSLLKHRS